MRIFLTGISGYVGQILAEDLSRLSEVDSITGIDTVAPTFPLPPKVTFIQMDIRSPDVAGVMTGHDTVIHAGFVVLWEARMPARERLDINMRGTENVALAAVRNKVARFIYISSMAAYDFRRIHRQSDVSEDFPLGTDNPYFYYWHDKGAAERIVEKIIGPSSATLTMFRAPYIIGPRNRVTVEGFRKNGVRFPTKNPRAQFVQEQDVTDAFARALSGTIKGVFNLCPDDCATLSEILEVVGKKNPPIIPVFLAQFIVYIQWRFFNAPIHPSWVGEALGDFTLSNKKLKGTGWKPRFKTLEALSSAL
ncbi:MAG: NAD-dependent epimerase/dehydratase family protein [Patescibacteria group bacterium]